MHKLLFVFLMGYLACLCTLPIFYTLIWKLKCRFFKDHDECTEERNGGIVMSNNCHYCNDEDCPELDWVYGLDHILPDYKFCPMCGRRVEVDRNYPLTLDELRGLIEKPVWVVNDRLVVRCALVYSPCSTVYLTFDDGTRWEAKDVLDKGCNIYRNKPEWCD